MNLKPRPFVFLPLFRRTVVRRYDGNLSTNHNMARHEHCKAVLLLVERFALGRTGVRQCDGKPEGN